MSSYIKASLERSYAESFLTDLERNDNQYFLFIGKGTTWADENTPSTYSDTVASEYQVMNDIIGYKKLSPDNILFAVPRYEWTSGTSYDQYDDAVNLFNDNDPKMFYVVTDENKIYKCLYNNSGAVSTVKPTPVITSPFTTSDGYRWKYLATVKESDLPYELTDYVPVDFAAASTDTETRNQYDAQIDAINASITRMEVQNGNPKGKYPNTIYSSPNSAVTLSVASFAEDTNDSTIKRVTITDSASRTKIKTLEAGTVNSNYVGYVLRVDASTVNAKEVNNYGIITDVTVDDQNNKIVITVKNDVVDFVVTPPTNTGNYASVQIIPYIKITGSGSGAYAFPEMKTSSVSAEDKTISSVTVINGGRDYSNVSARVISYRNPSTVDPTITVVRSPKGGHGSNILKELNVKDILIIVKLNEYDEEVIRGGGKYRQFGLIKNPLLGDGSSRVAGKENYNYRDITLLSVDGVTDTADFDLGLGNFIIGTETYSSAKPVYVKSINGATVVIKTINNSGKFISRQDRVNDYILTTNIPVSSFSAGEKISQLIPAGTTIGTGTGVSYGYDLTVEGTVLNYSSGSITARLSSGGNFIIGKEVTGSATGVTANVSAVAPRYGEMVWVSQTTGINGNEILSFRSRQSSGQKLYKIVDVSQAYFDLDQTPSYSGLHVLNLGSSISGACGGIDTTSAPLTASSFANGQFVQQGVSAGYDNYASGTVFDWEFINPSSGRLHLTDVSGKFKSVSTDGLTGSLLGNFIVTSVEHPQIERASGEVVYINNVRPVTRATGQEEEFRLRLGF